MWERCVYVDDVVDCSTVRFFNEALYLVASVLEVAYDLILLWSFLTTVLAQNDNRNKKIKSNKKAPNEQERRAESL